MTLTRVNKKISHLTFVYFPSFYHQFFFSFWNRNFLFLFYCLIFIQHIFSISIKNLRLSHENLTQKKKNWNLTFDCGISHHWIINCNIKMCHEYIIIPWDWNNEGEFLYGWWTRQCTWDGISDPKMRAIIIIQFVKWSLDGSDTMVPWDIYMYRYHVSVTDLR